MAPPASIAGRTCENPEPMQISASPPINAPIALVPSDTAVKTGATPELSRKRLRFITSPSTRLVFPDVLTRPTDIGAVPACDHAGFVSSAAPAVHAKRR